MLILIMLSLSPAVMGALPLSEELRTHLSVYHHVPSYDVHVAYTDKEALGQVIAGRAAIAGLNLEDCTFWDKVTGKCVNLAVTGLQSLIESIANYIRNNGQGSNVCYITNFQSITEKLKTLLEQLPQSKAKRATRERFFKRKLAKKAMMSKYLKLSRTKRALSMNDLNPTEKKQVHKYVALLAKGLSDPIGRSVELEGALEFLLNKNQNEDFPVAMLVLDQTLRDLGLARMAAFQQHNTLPAVANQGAVESAIKLLAESSNIELNRFEYQDRGVLARDENDQALPRWAIKRPIVNMKRNIDDSSDEEEPVGSKKIKDNDQNIDPSFVVPGGDSANPTLPPALPNPDAEMDVSVDQDLQPSQVDFAGNSLQQGATVKLSNIGQIDLDAMSLVDSRRGTNDGNDMTRLYQTDGYYLVLVNDKEIEKIVITETEYTTTVSTFIRTEKSISTETIRTVSTFTFTSTSTTRIVSTVAASPTYTTVTYTVKPSRTPSTLISDFVAEVDILSEKLEFGTDKQLDYDQVFKDLKDAIHNGHLPTLRYQQLGFRMRWAMGQIQDLVQEFYSENRPVSKKEIEGCRFQSSYEAFAMIDQVLHGFKNKKEEGYVLDLIREGFDNIYMKLISFKMYTLNGEEYQKVLVESPDRKFVYVDTPVGTIDELDSCSNDKALNTSCVYDVVTANDFTDLNFPAFYRCPPTGCEYQKTDGTVFAQGVTSKEAFLARFATYGNRFNSIFRRVIENKYFPYLTAVSGILMSLQFIYCLARCVGVPTEKFTVGRIRNRYQSERAKRARARKRLKKMQKEIRKKEREFQRKYGGKKKTKAVKTIKRDDYIPLRVLMRPRSDSM